MNVLVVNMKKFRGTCFRIDRTSPLGNEYTHLPLHLTRATFQVKTRSEAVTEGFNHIVRKIKSGDKETIDYLTAILESFHRGEEVILGCWCDPLPCHGHPLREAILDGSLEKLIDEHRRD